MSSRTQHSPDDITLAPGVRVMLSQLFRMCGGSQPDFRRVLHWLAYPVQNPNAKMRTAVISNGAENTGTSMFWAAVQASYRDRGFWAHKGAFGGNFNGWLANKRLVVCPGLNPLGQSVQVRATIKEWITGHEVTLRRKGHEPKVVPNRANFIFTTGCAEPVAVDSAERRFIAINSLPPAGEATYRELKEAVDGGAAFAFRDYLKALDLSDASAHKQDQE